MLWNECGYYGIGENGAELKEFLEARNPHHHHSLSLPALFAKPIVVRYHADGCTRLNR